MRRHRFALSPQPEAREVRNESQQDDEATDQPRLGEKDEPEKNEPEGRTDLRAEPSSAIPLKRTVAELAFGLHERRIGAPNRRLDPHAGAERTGFRLG